MKINRKEKILLSVISFIVVGYGYYNFVYIEQKSQIETLDIKRVELEKKYNETIETINNIDKEKGKIKELTLEMNSKTTEFYPEIIQEKIILELDKYINESKLEGNISFSKVEVNTIEPNEILGNKKEDSTFESFVSEYNGTNKNNENIKVEESQNSTGTEENKPTIENIKATITYKGKYTNVKDFIDKIEKSERKISITDLSMSAGLNGELTGSVNLEFYSIPKISNTDNEYSQWTIESKYGKIMPFVVEAPVEINQDSIGTIPTTNNNGDFSMILKSGLSDLPSVSISKVGDTSNQTTINKENKNIENIEFEFNKVGEKYYYKYKTSTNAYPKEYIGDGMEFTPINDKIIIDVLSESRVNSEDKSGVKITVKNNTDKLVEFLVSNDDTTNPRINIVGENGKVTMTKK